jgi:hypothetical protein
MANKDDALKLRDAVVKRYDVVVVGGGVAGLAITERLAREATRQGRKITILLVEQQQQLGTGASGGLEGWYHAGALYSKLSNTQFFANFLGAFEDLYNWYHFDPLFPFGTHCNTRDVSQCKRPEYDFPSSALPNGDGASGSNLDTAWFLGPLHYLLPRQTGSSSPDQERFDRDEWERLSLQAQSLIFQAFFEKEWVNEMQPGCCQSPYMGIDITLPDSRSVTFGDSVGSGNNEGAKNELHEANKDTQLGEIIGRLKGAEKGTTFVRVLSRDAAMNSWRVLVDLTDAAMQRGVEILRGYKMDPQSVQISPYGAVDRVTGLLLKRAGNDQGQKGDGPGRSDGEPDAVHLIAGQYVFALGLGFDESKLLHQRLGVHVKVEKKMGVMAVVTPPLCTRSFVRMDLHRKNDFNHIYRKCRTCDGQTAVEYSVVADSNFLPANALAHERVARAEELLEKAANYFGDKVRRNLVGWYLCDKTEFPPSDDEQRDYSYFWGPNWADWDEVKWREAHRQNRKTAQEKIRDYVLSHPQGDDLRLHESSWALKKAIHFALLHVAQVKRTEEPDKTPFKLNGEDLISLQGEGVPVEVAKGLELLKDRTFKGETAFLEEMKKVLGDEEFHCFQGIVLNYASTSIAPAHRTFVWHRNLASAAFRNRSQQQPSRKPNFLCVIPGKFSLFSTLAHQVYIEMELRGVFGNLELGKNDPRTLPEDESPVSIVARPHAENLLEQLRRLRFPLGDKPTVARTDSGSNRLVGPH